MTEAFNAASEIPESYSIDQEIDWNAPYVDVSLWVELPFWLMVEDTTVNIELGGHTFETSTYEHYFEFHVGIIADAKDGVVYSGPLKQDANLPESVRELLGSRPELKYLWRKSKTVLKIKSRCNEYVWNTKGRTNDVLQKSRRPAVERVMNFYLAELCRAHIPIVNKLIQQYRLATYDYFPYEVSPWDVSFWLIERNSHCVRIGIVPYREWDMKPRGFAQPMNEIVDAILAGRKVAPATLPYKLIEGHDLQGKMTLAAGPGEFELLDALNLMERGDYSGALRRLTTAIEVIVESVVLKAMEVAEGRNAALQFIAKSKMNFRGRLAKYETLSGGNFQCPEETAFPNTHSTPQNRSRGLSNRAV